MKHHCALSCCHSNWRPVSGPGHQPNAVAYEGCTTKVYARRFVHLAILAVYLAAGGWEGGLEEVGGVGQVQAVGPEDAALV